MGATPVTGARNACVAGNVWHKNPQCGVVSKREALREAFNQCKEDTHRPA